jgi:hypothetical protein
MPKDSKHRLIFRENIRLKPDSRVIVNDKHNRLGDGWVLYE